MTPRQKKWVPLANISESVGSFLLPENVDTKGNQAESKDGVLCVHIPKVKAEISLVTARVARMAHDRWVASAPCWQVIGGCTE